MWAARCGGSICDLHKKVCCGCVWGAQLVGASAEAEGCRVPSCRVVPCHAMSCHVISCRVVSGWRRGPLALMPTLTGVFDFVGKRA